MNQHDETQHELQRLKQLVNRLVKIGILFSKEKDTDRLLEMIVEESMYLTGSDAASIYIAEKIDGKDYIVFKTSKNDSIHFKMNGDKLPIDETSIAGYVALTGEPLVLNKSKQSLNPLPSFQHHRYYSEKYQYQAATMMNIPMKDYHGNVVGVLQVMNKKKNPSIVLEVKTDMEAYIDDYTQEDIDIIMSLASQTAILIEKIKLNQELEKNIAETRATMTNLFYTMKEAMLTLGDDILMEQEEFKKYATTDELTGVFTRREGLAYAQKQLELARVNNRPLAIGFIDVDGLKKVNDSYGHQEGDELLSAIANILKLEVRSNDTVIRYGGDEFIILLYNTTSRKAENAWNRILERFVEFNRESKKTYLLRASHGFSEYLPGSSDTIDSLIRQADERMYEEKMNVKGKNIL